MQETTIRARILQSARSQFTNLGFSKVTTDEIAAELGISKKTLYKYFPKKETLLAEVIEWTLKEMRLGAEDILNDRDLEFTKKLKAVMTFLGEYISKYLKKQFLQDIRKSAPEMWTRVEEFRKQQIQSKFSNLIKEGMQQNVFRNDIDQHLVVLVYFNAIQNIINPETLAHLPFSTSEAFESIIRIIFQGILTDEARENLSN